MPSFLLELQEWFGEMETMSMHYIEAENRQKVKYHYHKTMREWGAHSFAPDSGTHCLEGPGHGHVTDILSIKKVPSREATVLEKYLSTWTKV